MATVNRMFRLMMTTVLMLAWTTVSLAEKQRGGVVDPSTVLGFGSRPAGMGNAYVAHGDDATTVFWNPANLSLNRRYELFGQYSKTFFENSMYHMVAYKHPIGRFGTVGSGLIVEGMGDLTRRGTVGQNIGSFDISKMNFMVGYGKQISDAFYLGSTLHVVRHQIAEFSGTGFGLDVGALYRFTHPYVEYSRAYLARAKEQLHQQAEAYFEQGRQAYERGNYPQAFDLFEKALDLDRDYKEARKLRDRVAEDSRRTGRVLQTRLASNGHHAMSEFLKAHPADGQRTQVLTAWYNRGVELYDAGKLKEAVPFFEGVIRHARSNYVTDRLALGINVQNLIEPALTLRRVEEKLPMNVKFGSSYRLFDWLQFALDYDIHSDGPARAHLGLEWLPKPWLAFRTGLDNLKPTVGFGFRFVDLKFDYAFLPSSTFDNFQRMSLSYEFGKSQGTIASEQLQRGLSFRASKDYPKALEEWKRAQELQPSNPMPRQYIVETEKAYKDKVTVPWAQAERYLAAGDLAEADRLIRPILEHDPAFDPARRAKEGIDIGRQAFVEERYERGVVEFLIGNPSKTIVEMERVLYFQPGHASAKHYLDAARVRQTELQRRRERHDLHRKAMDLYQSGRWDESLGRLQLLMRADPTHPTAGALVDQMAQFRRAEFEPEEKKQEAVRFDRLAQSAFLKGKYDQAELMISHSLALDPEYPSARTLLQQLQARRNQEVTDALLRGDEAIEQGDADRALAAWQAMLDHDPDNADTLRRFEKNAERFRSFVQSMNAAAVRKQSAGENVAALKAFVRVLTVDPFNETAMNGQMTIRTELTPMIERDFVRATDFHTRQQFEQAIGVLDEIISINPDYAPARQLKTETERRLQEKVELDRVTLLFNEGMSHFRNLHFEQAIASWEQVMSEVPSHQDAKALLVQARERIDVAVREAELEEKFALGMQYQEQGNLMQAIQVWEEVRVADPQRRLVNTYLSKARQDLDEQVAEHLREGDRLTSEGYPLQALEVYRLADKVLPDNGDILSRIEAARASAASKMDVWIGQGQNALTTGQHEYARTVFNMVLRVDPENIPAVEGLKEADRQAKAESDRQGSVAQAGEWVREGADAFDARNYQRALELWQKARVILPEDADLARKIDQARQFVSIDQLYRDGVAAYEERNYEKALALLESVSALDPYHSQVRKYLELAREAVDSERRESERTKKADADQRLAAEISGVMKEADRIREKVQAAIDQNRLDLAIRRVRQSLDLYRKALQLDAQESAAKTAETELSRLLSDLQDRWKKQTSAQINQYLFSGLGHYREGRLREAIADWNRVLAVDADNAKAKAYIDRAEKKMERLKRSEQE